MAWSTLRDGRAPAAMRKALGDYFKGDLDRLADVEWRVAGTPFQQKVWHALPKIPPGTTMSYGALAARLNDAERDARRRPRQRLRTRSASSCPATA